MLIFYWWLIIILKYTGAHSQFQLSPVADFWVILPVWMRVESTASWSTILKSPGAVCWTTEESTGIAEVWASSSWLAFLSTTARFCGLFYGATGMNLDPVWASSSWLAFLSTTARFCGLFYGATGMNLASDLVPTKLTSSSPTGISTKPKLVAA